MLVIENIIDSEEILIIFKGLYLTSIDSILNMPISKFRNLSFVLAEQHKALKPLEGEIKSIQMLKQYVLHLEMSD